LRNAGVLFIMAKRHPVRNSQFMKVIRDVHSFFQEESFNKKHNQERTGNKFSDIAGMWVTNK
jgi:hypothetical protein